MILDDLVLQAQALALTAAQAKTESDAALASAIGERDAAINQVGVEIAARDAARAERDTAIAERDTVVAELDAARAQRDEAVAAQVALSVKISNAQAALA